MLEDPSSPIADVKRRLIDGMLEFMQGDTEVPNDEFDCGYKQSDVDQFGSIVDTYLDDVSGKSGSGDTEIVLAVKQVVLALNSLNRRCGGRLIETDQREDLCELILTAARQSGLTTTRDITEEWREW